MRRPILKLPIAILALVVVLYLGITSLALIDAATWHWAEVRASCWQTRCTLLVFGCFFGGVLRVVFLHPHYAPKYAGWLMSTPWHRGLQLPLGPVHLAWEDLLLVVLLGILSRVDAGLSPWLPAACYLLGYSIVSIGSVRGERGHWFTLGLAFLCSLPLLRPGSTGLLVCWMLMLAVYAGVGLSVSLADFPWDMADGMREAHRQPRSGLAWPLNRVGPVVMPKPIPLMLGWTAAALAGWWVFVVLNILSGVLGGVLLQMVAVDIPPVCAILCVLRLLYYCLGYWPPIGFLGRVMTGRLIIPGYDYVFMAPAVCCLLAYVMPRGLGQRLPLQISMAVTVLCMVGVAVNSGPTLRSWRLKGHHRMMAMTKREPVGPKTREPR